MRLHITGVKILLVQLCLLLQIIFHFFILLSWLGSWTISYDVLRFKGHVPQSGSLSQLFTEVLDAEAHGRFEVLLFERLKDVGQVWVLLGRARWVEQFVRLQVNQLLFQPDCPVLQWVLLEVSTFFQIDFVDGSGHTVAAVINVWLLLSESLTLDCSL